ncbi:pyridoxine/pyridoxal/pyridoxamine kinase [Cytobacillus kochii]|uniref:pyridoxine/pyridoxal/pyridoxamine kinase n=1 Tax=Cytobacillus kochii TaxID=859143 RepID=UPI001CD1FF7F|nr:pyridoxine/pyridoxal/pyridoxamine kinase [Cytobacillus kochii]MCA1026473.1 pyridoxine/pyridoxal/pyridoxamine kinase [Cytobacillus kochii]MCM3322379.1 pyridoxine/pyridoxal/pyridoxamine kinase [Cytobacillus kochii]MCM3345144.1 pyridoxine/pyridoxal/pyridoxamine kinase [Cytobacillus kochii]MDM5209697.1 pyridoxine/pyridoxal/pyridoxamine kinase [Cytobacillus kochii]
MTMKKVLTIAGSDSSGGAGIQADLKTFQELGVYGMSALTTIVTMDPKNDWHHNVFPIEISTLEAQIETILSVGIDAMKTGMLGSVEIIETAAKTIKESGVPAVIDPVMVCKGEDEVLHPETADALREVLVPLATVVTPNLFEASQLAQVKPIKTIEEMKKAAEKIHALGPKYVIIKGGSKLQSEKAIDLLFDGENFTILQAELINTPYIHGAGCTFSSAITAELAKGKSVTEAIDVAKDFITAAITHGFKLNDYVGPTMHGAYRTFGADRTKVEQ